jgi:heme exporter protein CcmD
MAEFFHMGGYAFYVWTSYALAVIVLVLNILAPIQRRRRLLRELAQRVRRERRVGQ